MEARKLECTAHGKGCDQNPTKAHTFRWVRVA